MGSTGEQVRFLKENSLKYKRNKIEIMFIIKLFKGIHPENGFCFIKQELRRARVWENAISIIESL